MDNNQQDPQMEKNPVWIKTTFQGEKKYKELLNETYKEDEIIVYFDQLDEHNVDGEQKRLKSLDERIKAVRDSFESERDKYNLEGEITTKPCDNCDIPVVLFKAGNIHSVINTAGVRGGSVPTPPVVGEKYSLNFLNKPPFEDREICYRNYTDQDDIDEKKEKIIVAVLDTGFDRELVDPRYLWESKEDNDKSDCYNEVESGWNFVEGNPDFSDDHPGRHGSIVSQYIINEFRNSPNNRVKIMPLKTHNKEGLGDLFAIICAIHFAIAKGANIINASWGFYYYYQDPIPYLSSLINYTLKNKGILFITAAGNKFAEEEGKAREIYQLRYGTVITDEQLRNLAIHNFYPAHLSNDINSIITVTTTDGEKVSPTQNFSNLHADLGVLADKNMEFEMPLKGSTPNTFISGSSFATAIASGIIGAYCPKKIIQAGLKQKRNF